MENRPSLPSGLAHHMALAIASVPHYKLFIFGGQQGGDSRSDWRYVKNVNCLDCGSMQWMSSDEIGSSFVEVRLSKRGVESLGFSLVEVHQSERGVCWCSNYSHCTVDALVLESCSPKNDGCFKNDYAPDSMIRKEQCLQQLFFCASFAYQHPSEIIANENGVYWFSILSRAQPLLPSMGVPTC